MNLTFCSVVLVIAIIGALVVAARNRSEREQALIAARDAYQSALARLKKDPTNADHKQHALSVGRDYAALTREQKAVTIFDEMALGNDIAAATAGATKATAGISVEERLRSLDDLRSKGLVSDAEYSQKRQKLLDEM
jgi:hypothetical protein